MGGVRGVRKVDGDAVVSAAGATRLTLIRKVTPTRQRPPCTCLHRAARRNVCLWAGLDRPNMSGDTQQYAIWAAFAGNPASRTAGVQHAANTDMNRNARRIGRVGTSWPSLARALTRTSTTTAAAKQITEQNREAENHTTRSGNVEQGTKGEAGTEHTKTTNDVTTERRRRKTETRKTVATTRKAIRKT
ncbi:MAG: hypothetical protein KGL39_01425 [Patescibacteria group bacterium]|nr:hypothetical protein [Patescibacteria group bacterium]